MTARTKWLMAAALLSLVMAVGTNTVDTTGSMLWFLRHTDGLGTLDTQPLAGAMRVHELLHRLGPDGRDIYLKEIVLFDLVFPVALLVTVHLALVQLWAPRWSRRLVLLPWLAFATDLAENTCAAVLTKTHPFESMLLANTIGWLTAAKFALYAVGMGCVALAAARLLPMFSKN
jgi:hypothetical protein